MTTMTFDTLGYFEKLKAAGMPEAQAKVQVEAMQDMVKNHDDSLRRELATKADLLNVKFDLLRWMIGIAAGQMALIVALFAFIK